MKAADASRVALDTLIPRQAGEVVVPLDAGDLEDELAAAAKTAARLGKPPVLRDQAADVISIVSIIRDEIVDLTKDADAAVEAAGQEAASSAVVATKDTHPNP